MAFDPLADQQPVPPIRVLLVDDHSLIRAGNALILGASGDFHVVGEASSGEEAITLTLALDPDVVLMDVRMPGIGGIEATRRIVGVAPQTKVVVLTTFLLDAYVFASLEAGASGFLAKSTTPAELISALRSVAAGEATGHAAIERALIERHVTSRQGRAEQHPRAALSVREFDVLQCVARGLANPEIAAELHLSVPTVKSHINRILSKLGTRDRVHLVILAYRHGIVAEGGMLAP